MPCSRKRMGDGTLMCHPLSTPPSRLLDCLGNRTYIGEWMGAKRIPMLCPLVEPSCFAV